MSSVLLLKYTVHLLRCCAQINPQRIKDTPAVNFRSRLVSVPSISKGLRKGYCQRGSLKRCGHLRCRLTKNSPQRIRTDRDVRSSKQQQVFR